MDGIAPGALTEASRGRKVHIMKTLTITVPEPVARWLDAAAKQRRQTPEQAAAEALASVAESRPPAPSLAHLLADSKGIGRGEYTDLSVNPRHLDDLGR